MLNSNASPTNRSSEMSQVTSTAQTCSQCKFFCDGICKTRAADDWGNASKVSPARTACFLAKTDRMACDAATFDAAVE